LIIGRQYRFITTRNLVRKTQRGRVIIYFLVGLFWKRRLVAEEGS